MRTYLKFSLLVPLSMITITLVGCGQDSGVARLEARLAEIEARPRGRIEPPPEFKPIASFSYAAHQMRAPFTPPFDETQADQPQGRQVEPDFTRPREYLERFSTDALRMVGTISRPSGPLEALVLDPTGAVNRIRVGSHMGRNFGRVVSVEEGRIGLVEIVPDGHDGWVERPRSVTLVE